MTHEYIGTKIVTAWPQEKEMLPGYAVKYADGYTSWSPKEVFEAAYIDIGHVSHLPPHQQRMIAEKAELDDRLTKLNKFMQGEVFPKLVEADRILMIEQFNAMLNYSHALGKRIDAAGLYPAAIKVHDSDCAQHNEPAKPNGSCDCSAQGTIEQEIRAKGLTAPRITPADIEANIRSTHYFTAAEGCLGTSGGKVYPTALDLLTFCVLVLQNGFIVTGESACASPENFDAELGRKIARENAINKVWPLMGYELRSKLAQGGAQ